MNKEQLSELVLQGLETEQGGVQVYTTALRCVQNDELRTEWEEYLEQTTRHEQIMTDVATKLGLDPQADTPGRQVVRHIGESLVAAMEMALANGPAAAAELVAGECVVLAETKDHQNWELLRLASEHADKPPQPSWRRPAPRSKTRRTSTSTTPPDGPASCGSSRWG